MADLSVTAGTITSPTQLLSFTGLAYNYQADLARFKQGQLRDNVLMFNTMNSSVNKFLNTTRDMHHIDESLDRSSASNLLIISFMAGFILLLLVPVILTLRKRADFHIKVFDIISSLDCQLVKDELETLCSVIESLQSDPYSLETRKASLNAMGKRNSSGGSNQMMLELNNYQKMREVKSTKSSRKSRKKMMLKKGRNEEVDNEAKLASIIRHFAVDEITKARESRRAKVQWRKRAGELEMAGTDADKDKWVVGQHWLLYSLVVVFVLLLGILAVIQAQEYSRIKDRKQVIIEMTNSQAEISYLFLMSKVMLRDNGLGAPTQYTPSFAIDTILNHSIFDLPQHYQPGDFDFSASY